jgi:predicted branched-subunit amino acid permease
VPVAISAVPFAVVVALSASEAGLSALSTVGMSVVVFAGAAQLTALELARTDAPAAIVIGAAIVVNLRFVLYSASLAPHVRDAPARARAAMAYLLTDQAFALTVGRTSGEHPRANRVAYFAGAAVTLWVAWQAGTVAGMLIGASVPPELSLDFAVALVFIALVVPSLDNRPSLAAAVTSIVVYIVAVDLPYGLALLPAAVAGIVAGAVTERASST